MKFSQWMISNYSKEFDFLCSIMSHSAQWWTIIRETSKIRTTRPESIQIRVYPKIRLISQMCVEVAKQTKWSCRWSVMSSKDSKCSGREPKMWFKLPFLTANWKRQISLSWLICWKFPMNLYRSRWWKDCKSVGKVKKCNGTLKEASN